MSRSYAASVTTPPQDPFGTPREGEGRPSDQQPGQQYGQQYGQQSGQQYGPAYGQQYGPAYGQPVQGYGAPPAFSGPTQTESKAIIALVCAIASWVVFPTLPAIAALMIGKTARQEIRQSGGRLTGDGLVTAARVIAWANLAATVLVIVLIVLAITLFAASTSDFPVR